MSEFYFESHLVVPCSLNIVGQWFIIASFGLLREDHSFGSFYIALSGIEMDRDPGSGNLVLCVMTDGTASQNNGMFVLIEHGVIACAPAEALADMYVAIGGHVLHLMEIFAVFDVEQIAGKSPICLGRVHMATKEDPILLVIQSQRIRLYTDWTTIAARECTKRAVGIRDF
jgi:hypothetical protein